MIEKTRHIKDTKKLVGMLPAIRYTEPKYLFIATANARCPKADLYVKEGDHVNSCQVIGMRHGPFFEQPIHATCSGTYLGLEKHYHRNGKLTDFIKLENDFKDTIDPSVKERTPEEIAALTKEEMTEIIKQTANVGLGGSSFPTYIKFQTDKPINLILINGIECEPYITADHRLMLEFPYRIMEGIKYVMQAFNCKHAKICIKSKYKDIKEVYTQMVKEYAGSGIELCLVGNYYPQGWEVEMIKNATGIQLKPGELPSNRGIINFNVSTMVGIYKAIRYNMPVIKRFITITGDGINFPKNFRVRVGTPVKELIPMCGGYKNPDKERIKSLNPLRCIECGLCTYTCTSKIQVTDYVRKAKMIAKL